LYVAELVVVPRFVGRVGAIFRSAVHCVAKLQQSGEMPFCVL
jgi:hypothetical protein